MNSVYMKKAIEIALKGTGRTSPNPLVGAIAGLKYMKASWKKRRLE